MKPKVKLIGEDGNVFNLIGIVSSVLKGNDKVEFQKRVMSAGSYDEVLCIINK